MSGLNSDDPVCTGRRTACGLPPGSVKPFPDGGIAPVSGGFTSIISGCLCL